MPTLNSSARNMGALAVCGTSGDSMTAYSVLHTGRYDGLSNEDHSIIMTALCTHASQRKWSA